MPLIHSINGIPLKYSCSPDLGSHNVAKTVEMAIQHNRRTARTELERVFSALFFLGGSVGSRVDNVLDSGAGGHGLKSQPRRCRVTILRKLFTPIVPLFTKQQNW